MCAGASVTASLTRLNPSLYGRACWLARFYSGTIAKSAVTPYTTRIEWRMYMGSKKLFSDEPTTRTELYEAALVKIKDVCEDDDPAYLIAEAILEYTDGRRYNTSSGKTKPPSFTLPTGGGKGGGSNEGKELQPA